MSARHREGLAHLLYGIQMGGFVILTGEVGTGKTTLCRCLLEKIPDNTNIALILNPKLNSIELLANVCDELAISYPAGNQSLKVFTDLVFHFLLSAHAQGRKTVLMIDEAQNLSFEVLEQIRLLTNLETSTTKLLQIILVGQPELKKLLNSRELRQLNQRITARYHLQPLSHDETRAYIRHRLLVGGGDSNIFKAGAVRRIHRLSGGIPRSINILCDRALLGAYATNKRSVSKGIVDKAAREVLPDDALRSYPANAGLLAVMFIVVLLAGGLYVRFLQPAAQKQVPVVKRTALPAANAADTGAGGKTSSERPSETAASNRQQTKKPAGNGRVSKTGVAPPTGSSTDRESQTFQRLIGKSGLSLEASLEQLLQIWSEQIDPAAPTVDCDLVQKLGLRCLMDIDNLDQILALNRPAILEFSSPDGAKRYGLLIGVAQEGLPVIRFDDDYVVQMDDLMAYWQGYYLIMWKPPDPEIQEIHPRHFSDHVLWLRKQLDAIDGRSDQANRPRLYDKALQQRVVAFQHRHHLLEDGIVGPKTIIHLQNSMPAINFPLLETTD